MASNVENDRYLIPNPVPLPVPGSIQNSISSPFPISSEHFSGNTTGTLAMTPNYVDVHQPTLNDYEELDMEMMSRAQSLPQTVDTMSFHDEMSSMLNSEPLPFMNDDRQTMVSGDTSTTTTSTQNQSRHSLSI